MYYTRYALLLKHPESTKWIWNCQGEPKDPSDFGFAILYANKELAKKASQKIKYPMGKKHGDNGILTRMVPVLCQLNAAQEIT